MAVSLRQQQGGASAGFQLQGTEFESNRVLFEGESPMANRLFLSQETMEGVPAIFFGREVGMECRAKCSLFVSSSERAECFAKQR
jgi:hypothetical protein